MPPSNVVVDGSNIATQGRTTPSLEQLDQAVRQYLEEHPGANVTVVVDASFGHRIAPSESAAFEQAVAHGELVSPPAGAIGRGDAFLLRIAGRIGARVLSNDSFREFHVEHPWLFDEDRLVGGTPVPGVGWIFTPRRPVRGPLTPAAAGPARRGSKKSADHASAGEDDESDADRAAAGAAAGAESSSPETTNPKGGRSRSRRGKASDRKVQDAIAEATEEALTSGKQKQQKGKPKPKSEAAPEAVNDPLPFITFASEHPVGSEVQGTVVSFTSHGAMAQVEDMLCYVPLAGLGDPPPRRARDVLHQGETRTFELVALDPARRGAQLALPEVVAVHGEIAEGAEEAASEVRRRRKRRGGTSSSAEPEHATPGKAEPTGVARQATKQAAAREKLAGSTKAPSKRPARTERGTQATRVRGAKSAEPAKKIEAGKETQPAKKTEVAKKTQPAKKVQAAKKGAPAKKVAAKKAPTKKAVAAKTSPVARIRPAKKAASKATDKATDSASAAHVRKSPIGGKASVPRRAPASRKAGAGDSKATSIPQKTSSSRSKAVYKTAPTKTAPTKTAPTKTAPTKTAPTKTAPTKTAAKKAGQAKAGSANKRAKTTKGPGKPAKQ